MLNIGCHVSSSKGYVQMLKDTLYIGGNTFAWFTRNPRGGQAKAVDPIDLEKFIALAQENNFTYLAAVRYLIKSMLSFIHTRLKKEI